MNISGGGNIEIPQTPHHIDNCGANIDNGTHHSDTAWSHHSPLSSPCPTCGSPMKMIRMEGNEMNAYHGRQPLSGIPPTKSIQVWIDDAVAQQSQPWRGSIPFKCHVIFGEKGDPFINTPLQDIDICKYLNGGVFKAKRLYFCPKTYPPPGQVPVNEADSWNKLKLDLGNASHSAGSPIVSNGGGRTQRSFKCQVVHRARESLATITDANTKHRGTSLINDALANSRGKMGLAQPRKRKIAFEGTSCKFNFDVKWDEYGYYVNLFRDAGNPIHNNHPKPVDLSVIPYSSRLLADETKKELQNVVDASRSHCVARNYALKSQDKYLDVAKMAYLSRKAEAGGGEHLDDISMMLEQFKHSNEIAYTTMSDVPLEMFEPLPPGDENRSPHDQASLHSTVTISTTKNEAGELIINRPSEDDVLSQVETVAKRTRVERKISASQYLFFSIAWIHLPVFRFFKLCPEVIWCDVTSHSNKMGYKLLTFSCRTSVNKQVVFMYIWIPNEQRISFRWVFSHAISQLVPAWLRSRVKFIMKDGDPQQRNEILIALQSVFMNAIEGGCGWHMVEQGWKDKVPGENFFSTKNRMRWKKVTQHVKRWMYSWMKPGRIEDADEYKISKFLLLQFICSRLVLDAADGKMEVIMMILRFLQNHVFVYEHLYLHYMRKHIRHFDISHSCAHEGTNLGLKSHSASMKATMTLKNSSQTLALQSTIQAKKLGAMIHSDFVQKNKLWSNSPTASFTLSFAEGLIQAVYQRQQGYVCERIGERVFQVRYVSCTTGDDTHEQYEDGSEDKKLYSALPRFTRIRIVTVDDNNVMYCSCCRFECIGIFCVHQVVTAVEIYNELGEQFDGFTHHDVALRYRSDYMELAYNPLADKDIQMRFHELALADVKGPRLGAEIPSTMATHHPSKILPALDRLSNYNRNDIDLTIVDGMYCSDFVPECDESGTNHAEVNATFEAMFQQLQNVTSEESSQLFSAAISDAELPKMHASGTSVPPEMHYDRW
ncbi:LOW QUALITY PROTEIN: hypothetical protein ACHAWU_005148 [Discostella pseudostelligera]|uniref:SWIM-type domain-containing protein n=1 Tax=Discostella pseudostelligera TaxID=259834 RepID=A0ABD3M5H5_9STRA